LWSKGWQESTKQQLKITDCSYPVFLFIMRYIYSGKFVADDETGSIVVEILAYSNQLALFNLKSACESFIISGLDESNSADLKKVAETYNAQRLLTKCLNFKKK
jgi:hypothetical protein